MFVIYKSNDLKYDNFTFCNSIMDHSHWQKSIQALHNHVNGLQESINIKNQRFTPFNNIFLQIIKACDKFASSLCSIADTCDQELLSNLSQTEESLGSNYIPLKSGLLSLVQTWRLTATRSKQQIIQPLKVFGQNYRKVSTEIINKLKNCVGICMNNQKEIIKLQETYYNYCQKLQKHKENQAKIMIKIQNGQITELQKFNKTTKTLIQKVSAHQKKYMQSVQKTNEETLKIKKIIEKQVLGIRHNQVSRVQFLKKIASNQLKILQNSKNINLNYKSQTQATRIEGKGKTDLTDSLYKLEQFSKNNIIETFISHDQLVKSKKNKDFEQENPLLMELFKKIKQSQKISFRQFVNGCLEFQPACHLISIQKITKIDYKMVFPPQWQTFREKILSLQHYLFYFTFILNRELNDLPNYYIKLTPPFFNHLKNLLVAILEKIQMTLEGSMGQVALGIAYKILKLAQRVVENKQGRKSSTNMKIMIQDLGKCKKLRDEKNLMKFFKYFIKKGQKKKNEGKGMMNLTKSFLFNLGVKKDENEFEQDQFNALVELTHLMANLSLPIEITLPLLKSILKNTAQTSFNYLKDILQNRRNRQERQKLILEEDPRYKLQFQYKNIIQLKQESIMCLKWTAQKGFLNKKDIQLRLCCKRLSLIHYDIIYKLPQSLSYQWRLISNPNRKQEFKGTIQKFVENQKLDQIEEIIILDVNRSLHMHTQSLSHEDLKKFLICYARNHPQMQYCQGMNYLAGYILLKNNNHESSYGIFCEVMRNYFFGVFVNSFHGMKKKMYVFDRIFSIFHPDLSDHFKRQMITSQCYIVGWIITAFTSTYQYTKKSIIVDWFWRRFYFWGWRQFYKFTMWIFYLNKDVLIAANYDKCLQVLGQITKCPLMIEDNVEIFKAKWKSQLQLIDELYPITSNLINKLNQQYEHSEI